MTVQYQGTIFKEFQICKGYLLWILLHFGFKKLLLTVAGANFKSLDLVDMTPSGANGMN